ncbi:MAG: protein translocase subunit SecF [bacterium]|nr:protein translocase subunit SecF [bacterium]
MVINFLKYRKVYYILSTLLIIASLASLLFYGLKFGIEFTGGSLLDLEFKNERPTIDALSQNLSGLNMGEIVFQPAGDKEMLFKMKNIDEETHQKLLAKLRESYSFEEKSFDLIGPAIGKELKQKTAEAIVLALLAITAYVAFAFRKISRTISSWQCGVTSLVALFHDIIIPLGVLSVLGKFSTAEITIPIIAALLTILGYSVHDTIVIFDRVRENVLKGEFSSFEEAVNAGLNQTIGRSVNTVLTVLIVLFAIFFFGGETLKYFSLTLIIGIASGAYSSIFIASPLLVSWLKWRKKI